MGQPVARLELDQAGTLLISAPQSTVFANDTPAGSPALVATEGSVSITGNVVIASQTTVFVEDKKIAIDGAQTATGVPVSSSNTTVFAGNTA